MPSTEEKNISLRVFEQELRAAGLWDEALITAWEEQVAANTFSPVVQGLGTLRVAGRSGDAPLTFPQITSLAVLDESDTAVTAAERYILGVTRAIVEAAPTAGRKAFDVVPAHDDQPPKTTPMPVFLPMTANIVIVTRVAGG